MWLCLASLAHVAVSCVSCACGCVLRLLRMWLCLASLAHVAVSCVSCISCVSCTCDCALPWSVYRPLPCTSQCHSYIYSLWYTPMLLHLLRMVSCASCASCAWIGPNPRDKIVRRNRYVGVAPSPVSWYAVSRHRSSLLDLRYAQVDSLIARLDDCLLTLT
jgi:hypothetical protein